jgi:uncharacterized membrane protein YgdD (TMEM256/DUF423 family)
MISQLTRGSALRLTALLGAMGVVLGAFGAHGLEERLISGGHLDHWKTATTYHLVHAVALLGICTLPRFPRLAWTLMLAGILLFSGALYILSLTDQKWLGAVAPIGGTLLIAGWIALAWKAKLFYDDDPAS